MILIVPVLASFAFLFPQVAPRASVLPLCEIVLKLGIAFRHLLLTELVAFLFLLEQKQQILLPVAFQAACDLLLTRLYVVIAQRRQLIGISLSLQDGVNNGLSALPGYIASYVGQLDVHLCQRLLHPLDMSARTPQQVLTLPPIGPHGTNLL